jgi:hypothetical protein
VSEKKYEIPESLMNKIVGILNQLPFGQVASVMAELHQALNTENKKKEK